MYQIKENRCLICKEEIEAGNNFCDYCRDNKSFEEKFKAIQIKELKKWEHWKKIGNSKKKNED